MENKKDDLIFSDENGKPILDTQRKITKYAHLLLDECKKRNLSAIVVVCGLVKDK